MEKNRMKVFYTTESDDDNLKYPKGYIRFGHAETITIKKVTNSNEHVEDSTTKIDEHTLTNYISVENNNLKIKGVDETKNNFYIILDLNGIDIAIQIDVEDLNFLFKDVLSISDITKKDFIVVENGLNYYTFIPQDKTDVRYLAHVCNQKLDPLELYNNLNIGSVYLNKFGEKSIYIGKLAKGLAYDFIIGKEDKKLSMIEQDIWLPLTTTEYDTDLNKIPIAEKVHEDLIQLLDSYFSNSDYIYKKDILLNLTKAELIEKNVINLLNKTSLLSTFKPVVEYKKLLINTQETEVDFSDTIKDYATRNIIKNLYNISKINIVDREETENFTKEEVMRIVDYLIEKGYQKDMVNLYFISTYELNSPEVIEIVISWERYLGFIHEILNRTGKVEC